MDEYLELRKITELQQQLEKKAKFVLAVSEYFKIGLDKANQLIDNIESQLRSIEEK